MLERMAMFAETPLELSVCTLCEVRPDASQDGRLGGRVS
jgi:hypothetical protein